MAYIPTLAVLPYNTMIYYPKPGVPKLGYVCLPERVHLRLALEGKNMSTFYSFRNMCTYISEYYFQNHYMRIVNMSLLVSSALLF